jgi:cleavage and polyadenylation specificity factor subunit 1
MPFALHQEVLRPSGVEFAISLNLVAPLAVSSSPDIQVLGNLVVARSNVLKVFEIRRQYASLRADLTTRSESFSALRGDGAERGVEMETQGDDFVNVGEFKVIAGANNLSTLLYRNPAPGIMANH